MLIKKIPLYIKKYPYFLLAVFLIIIEVLLISKKQWKGDFWEHSAVVNELIRNIFHPSNPIIKAEIPHAFFSPYSVIVAAFAKLSGLNSIEALHFFAYFNLAFLLLTFYLFCKKLFNENANQIAALGLVFMLFFWGHQPPVWSGFYHFYALHYVLPYPSTFAISLSFLVMYLLMKNGPGFIKFNIDFNKLLVIFLSTIVVITHPVTAVFLFISIGSYLFIFSNYQIKRPFLSFVILTSITFLLCLLWPYYNYYELIFSNNADFDNDSEVLYHEVFINYWPALLALPAYVYARKNKAVSFLSLAVLLLAIVYAAAYFSGSFGLGRLISGIMVFTHLIIAFAMINFTKEKNKIGLYFSTLVAIFILFSIFINRRNLVYNFKLLSGNQGDTFYYENYAFLSSFVKPGDVILSDENTNYFIPSFGGGKVISSAKPLYWVDDVEERRKAIKLFFNKDVADSLKQDVLQKYQPDFILIDKMKVDFQGINTGFLKKTGEKVYEKNGLELIKLKKQL